LPYRGGSPCRGGRLCPPANLHLHLETPPGRHLVPPQYLYPSLRAKRGNPEKSTRPLPNPPGLPRRSAPRSDEQRGKAQGEWLPSLRAKRGNPGLPQAKRAGKMIYLPSKSRENIFLLHSRSFILSNTTFLGANAGHKARGLLPSPLMPSLGQVLCPRFDLIKQWCKIDFCYFRIVCSLST